MDEDAKTHEGHEARVSSGSGVDSDGGEDEGEPDEEQEGGGMLCPAPHDPLTKLLPTLPSTPHPLTLLVYVPPQAYLYHNVRSETH